MEFGAGKAQKAWVTWRGQREGEERSPAEADKSWSAGLAGSVELCLYPQSSGEAIEGF